MTSWLVALALAIPSLGTCVCPVVPATRATDPLADSDKALRRSKGNISSQMIESSRVRSRDCGQFMDRSARPTRSEGTRSGI